MSWANVAERPARSPYADPAVLERAVITRQDTTGHRLERAPVFTRQDTTGTAIQRTSSLTPANMLSHAHQLSHAHLTLVLVERVGACVIITRVINSFNPFSTA